MCLNNFISPQTFMHIIEYNHTHSTIYAVINQQQYTLWKKLAKNLCNTITNFIYILSATNLYVRVHVHTYKSI